MTVSELPNALIYLFLILKFIGFLLFIAGIGSVIYSAYLELIRFINPKKYKKIDIDVTEITQSKVNGFLLLSILGYCIYNFFDYSFITLWQEAFLK